MSLLKRFGIRVGEENERLLRQEGFDVRTEE